MNKKTSTVAFSNLIGALIFLAVGIWAWFQTLGFKTVKNSVVQPATFPQIMIVGLLIFAAILLVQSLWQLARMKPEDPAAEKAPSINPFRDKGVQAALLVIALCIAYVAFFKVLGYVLISFLVCFLIMVLIGKRNWLQKALVSLLVPLCMFLLFYLLLKVNIPMGPLSFLRDLLDSIL